MNIFKRSMLLSFFAVAGMYAMEGSEHVDTVSDPAANHKAVLAEHDAAMKDKMDALKERNRLRDSYYRTPVEGRADVTKKIDAAGNKLKAANDKLDSLNGRLNESFRALEEANKREKLQKDAAAKKAPDVSDAMFESLAPEVAPEVALKPGEMELSKYDKGRLNYLKTNVLDKISSNKEVEESCDKVIDINKFSEMMDAISKGGKITPEHIKELNDMKEKLDKNIDALLGDKALSHEGNMTKEALKTMTDVMNKLSEQLKEVSGAADAEVAKKTEEVKKGFTDGGDSAMARMLKAFLPDFSKLTAGQCIVAALVVLAIAAIVVAFHAAIAIGAVVTGVIVGVALTVAVANKADNERSGSDSDDYVAMNPAIGY
ncbi:MAG: hypothetical protein NTU89_00895 [Candidatus Dependentiae bacterium]|nr:hypothetical protein [Candidatus Dependentiae bacterium]